MQKDSVRATNDLVVAIHRNLRNTITLCD